MGRNLINVDKKYFCDEVIDDFLVTERVKRALMSELEVLVRFEKICNDLGITYYASWGTLLGAIRHGGFIPWDDDIDIFMMRKDYNILKEYAQKGPLPDGLLMIDDTMVNNFNNLTARVVNGDSIVISQEYLKMYHGCPYVTGLDIDVLDKKAPNRADDELQTMLIDSVLKLALYFRAHDDMMTESGQSFTSEEDVLDTIKAVENACGVKVNRNENLFLQMHILKDKLSQMYENTPSDTLQVLGVRVAKNLNAAQFKTDLFSQSLRIPFGPVSINVPIGYHEILKQMYGNDYLIPANRKAAHDYPFFLVQEPTLEELLESIGMTRKDLGIA
ncbi:MAG: LicD family protein [Butyrivibrio sp.]|uniref:LicD family protein n=1 Tax=Butyrivibrio sp. TaxID=28121 RepID=UPI0025FAE500|nr:LicD family protein [Butyrivibrio sp.]MCR5773100.1 LicD family protein [Butyrivibrio sp.]